MEFLLLFLCLCLMTSVKAANNIGNPCTLRSGGDGFCRMRVDCLHAVGRGKQPPTFCSRRDGILCCPDQKRLSEEKCFEYYKNDPPCDNTPLIVGGTKTKPGEYPHMAAIGYKDGDTFNLFCGGTLISDQYIMTAGHCASNALGDTPNKVRLGVDNYLNQFAGEYDVDSFTKHPEYSPIKTRYNDIALIKLKETVVFDKQIKPACLWQTEEGVIGNTSAIGFGAVGFMDVNSEDLLKVILKVQDTEVCDRLYPKGKFKLPNGFQKNQLCVGELSGGMDTCQGDSGGPIHMVNPARKICAHYVAGVTSFGKPCGTPGSAAIYTRVSSFLDWIEDVVWKSQ